MIPFESVFFILLFLVLKISHQKKIDEGLYEYCLPVTAGYEGEKIILHVKPISCKTIIIFLKTLFIFLLSFSFTLVIFTDKKFEEEKMMTIKPGKKRKSER